MASARSRRDKGWDRWRDRKIAMSHNVELFFASLLGKRNARGFAEWRPKRYWRKLYLRLIDSLERYICTNVITDKSHRDDLAAALKYLRQAIEISEPQREAELVTSFAALCLLLLGDRPDHRHRSIVNRPKHYLLAEHRSVHYSQTPAQIARLIWSRCIRPELSRSRVPQEFRAMERSYWRHVRLRLDAEFVAWFRAEHPDKFLRLFV
jgi:hypothetical protein